MRAPKLCETPVSNHPRDPRKTLDPPPPYRTGHQVSQLALVRAEQEPYLTGKALPMTEHTEHTYCAWCGEDEYDGNHAECVAEREEFPVLLGGVAT